MLKLKNRDFLLPQKLMTSRKKSTDIIVKQIYSSLRSESKIIIIVLNKLYKT